MNVALRWEFIAAPVLENLWFVWMWIQSRNFCLAVFLCHYINGIYTHTRGLQIYNFSQGPRQWVLLSRCPSEQNSGGVQYLFCYCFQEWPIPKNNPITVPSHLLFIVIDIAISVILPCALCFTCILLNSNYIPINPIVQVTELKDTYLGSSQRVYATLCYHHHPTVSTFSCIIGTYDILTLCWGNQRLFLISQCVASF